MFRVWGLGFRVQGLGFVWEVQGLGFRVSGIKGWRPNGTERIMSLSD